MTGTLAANLLQALDPLSHRLQGYEVVPMQRPSHEQVSKFRHELPDVMGDAHGQLSRWPVRGGRQ